ncbi:hypothetical protein MRB53_029760 [Persea americana]|uniref:Uncharacterized protein n=1 Tax=Persea americana TaxID=3435 RepID=A0ACC2KJN1_PERAE|nr:hypothetical protein MRB53_029760 [Persea americana]
MVEAYKHAATVRSKKAGNGFTRKCAALVKEQRARIYILRRCATMLLCWYIQAGAVESTGLVQFGSMALVQPIVQSLSFFGPIEDVLVGLLGVGEVCVAAFRLFIKLIRGLKIQVWIL